ncbi:MAG: hypothetical protein RBT22_00575 [Aliarcobacter sp.]|jgi:hypothetical protein|nr:hypothetical protein [Aliarcobacter sp.]
MGEDDYLEDDNEEFSPPPPTEDIEIKAEKKEEPKKEEPKPQLAIGIENIQDLLLSFQFAAAKLEEASKKIKEEPKKEDLNFEELFENQKNDLKKEIEDSISKIKIPEIGTREPEKVDEEIINNLAYELSNFSDNLREIKKSKKTMILISIIVSSFIIGGLSFTMGMMFQKNSFLSDYVVFFKANNQFSKLTDGRIIVIPSIQK